MSGNICIIGAGAWGTALALTACRAGNLVTLISSNHSHVQTMLKNKQNQKYLPGIVFPENLMVSSDFTLLSHADIVLQVTPAQSFPEVCKTVYNDLPPNIPWVICAKGIMKSNNGKDPQLLSDVSRYLLSNPVVVLSGPSFASEVGKNLPTAVTVASNHENAARQVCESLRHNRFRCYISDDLIGVQVAGAVKNILAIACGIVKGKRFGSNATSALMTRGLAEMRRLGIALGGKSETIFGLSGVGDVNLTCSDEQSRNLRLGKMIGESVHSPENILTNIGFVTEGVPTVQAVYTLAQKMNLSMPICNAIYSILYENIPVDRVIEDVLSRQSQTEF